VQVDVAVPHSPDTARAVSVRQGLVVVEEVQPDICSSHSVSPSTPGTIISGEQAPVVQDAARPHHLIREVQVPASESIEASPPCLGLTERNLHCDSRRRQGLVESLLLSSERRVPFVRYHHVWQSWISTVTQHVMMRWNGARDVLSNPAAIPYISIMNRAFCTAHHVAKHMPMIDYRLHLDSVPLLPVEVSLAMKRWWIRE